MSIIHFNGTAKDWYSDRMSEALRIIIRALAMRFDGIYITCMIRSKAKNVAVKGRANSKLQELECGHGSRSSKNECRHGIFLHRRR